MLKKKASVEKVDKLESNHNNDDKDDDEGGY